jgi:hypothetical protein
MRHNRAEVIQRTIGEFDRLERIVSSLKPEDWNRPLPRPETKEPWTVKDALAHITFWKADVIRAIRKQRQAAELRGLNETQGNHLIFTQWHERSPQDVLAWHRQVQADLLEALRAAPEAWFNGRERRPEWPYDLDGHSSDHRVKDIEQALAGRS